MAPMPAPAAPPTRAPVPALVSQPATPAPNTPNATTDNSARFIFASLLMRILESALIEIGSAQSARNFEPDRPKKRRKRQPHAVGASSGKSKSSCDRRVDQLR